MRSGENKIDMRKFKMKQIGDEIRWEFKGKIYTSEVSMINEEEEHYISVGGITNK